MASNDVRMVKSPVMQSGQVLSVSQSNRDSVVSTVLRKRWWVLLLCAVAAGVFTASIASQFPPLGKWTYSSAVLHTGLPLASVSGYNESTSKSEAVVLVSNKLLAPLIVKHNLDASMEHLRKQIDVKVTDELIDVSFEWEDSEVGERVLNDLLETFVDEVAQRRALTLANFCRDLERSLLANQARLEHARDKVALFRANNPRSDAARTAESLVGGVALTENALDGAQVALTGLQSQLKGLQAQRGQLLVQAKQLLLESKRTKHATTMAYHLPGSEGHTQLSEALAKLEKMTESVAEDELDLRAYQEQLRSLGAKSSGSEKEGAKSSLSEKDQKTLERIEVRTEVLDDKIRDAEFAAAAKAAEVSHIQARLEEKQKRLADPTMHGNEPLELIDEVRQAEKMQDEIAAQLAGSRQLEKCKVREFTIVSPATLAKEVAPNWLKRIVVIFSASMMILMIPVIGWEFLSSRGTAADAAARRFGLPVLARMSRGSLVSTQPGLSVSGKEELRLLALRIQQFIPNAGSVILFSPLDPADSPIGVICQLAECFADREERVLIVDMGISTTAGRDLLLTRYMTVSEQSDNEHRAAATTANGVAARKPAAALGITDFLRDESLDFASLVTTPTCERVHCIPAGEREFPRECFGTRRMTDFLEQCRRRYSMVLVSAPPASESADLQMLAARSDGILFTASQGKRRARHNYHALQELMDLDAPVLGVVG